MQRRTKSHRGFTLIEMVTTFAVFAILAALGAPSMRDFTIDQRIKSMTYDLYGDLVYARSEAIKSNSEVVFKKATGGWNNGWIITWVDTGGVTRILRARTGLDSSLDLAGSLDSIKFERNGRLLVGTLPAKFTIDDSGGKASITARCVMLDPSGMPKSATGACA